ncbi:MAG: hypothetical protein Q3995_06100, partial [Eubacteriales bacterium]|nr:hypothetical protein [Eubacteriales bacterium]
GYGKNGEFEGTDWELHVAQIAQQLKVLKNVKAVSLKTAATRELVAELLFRVAADVKTVTYTPAFGYVTSDIAENVKSETLGVKNFKLDYEEDYTDEWGRPCKVWFADDNKKYDHDYNDDDDTLYAELTNKVVKSYTDTVEECDVLKAIGKKDGTKVDYYENGVQDEYTLKDADDELGGHGVLLEVYELDDDDYDYRLVRIDTYFAQVTDVVALELDKNGHVETEAEITVGVAKEGDQEFTLTSKKADFKYEEDDYVLVNFNEADDEDSVIIGLAEKKTVEPTATKDTGDFNDSYFKVDSKTYNYAAQFAGNLNYDAGNSVVPENGILDADSHDEKVVVYLDQYGNVIADDEVEEDEVTGAYIILDAEDKKAGTKDWYVEVTALDENGKEVTLKVGDDDGKKFESTEEADGAASWIEDHCVYSLVKATETSKYMKLENNDGTADANIHYINKGDANDFGNVNVDSATIFAVAKYNKDNEETGKFDFYKGIKNLPNLAALDNNGISATYVTLNEGKDTEYSVVLIKNAKKYSVTTSWEYTQPTNSFFVLLDTVPEVEHTTYSEYKALVDGKKTTVKLDNDWTEAELTENALFEILGYEEESGKKFIADVDCVGTPLNEGTDGFDFTVTGNGCKNDILYTTDGKITLDDDCKIVDLDGKAVKAKDIEAGDVVYVVYAPKTDYAAYIYVTGVNTIEEDAAAALAAAKTNAKTAIDAYVNALVGAYGVSANDLKTVIDAQKGAVDNAKTVAEAEAIAKMNGNNVVGTAQVALEAKALELYKADAKDNLAEYAANVENTEDVIAAAEEAIDAAVDFDAVDTAVNAAKDAIDAIDATAKIIAAIEALDGIEVSKNIAYDTYLTKNDAQVLVKAKVAAITNLTAAAENGISVQAQTYAPLAEGHTDNFDFVVTVKGGKMNNVAASETTITVTINVIVSAN